MAGKKEEKKVASVNLMKLGFEWVTASLIQALIGSI